MITTDIKLIEDGCMPERKTTGAVAYDCYAREDVEIPAWGIRKVPLGFALQMDAGIHAIVCSRSGAMLKGLITLTGIIDSDYRGELSAVVFNADNSDRLIAKGDRISQLKFAVTLQHDFKQVDELDATKRGDNGFGSTGERG